VFTDNEEQNTMLKLLEEWTTDPENIKEIFIAIKDYVLAKKMITLRFISRPGISYSLRAVLEKQDKDIRPLFVMVDIIDDNPSDRWLSVCFYGDMISDPDELGDLVPGGLLGEDGHCFDFYEHDKIMLNYIKARINEAYNTMAS